MSETEELSSVLHDMDTEIAVSVSATEAEEDIDSSERFYINDDTVFGKLYKTDLSNPDVERRVDRFYRQNFCCPLLLTGEDSHAFLIVSVCENQRFIPIKGWNCLHLLPSDPCKLSNSSGLKFPYRYLKRTDPPKFYMWPSDLNVPGFDPSNGWMVEGGDVGGGWRYAQNFDKFSDPEYKKFPHIAASMFDVVRRRKWIRVAKQVQVDVGLS